MTCDAGNQTDHETEYHGCIDISRSYCIQLVIRNGNNRRSLLLVAFVFIASIVERHEHAR